MTVAYTLVIACANLSNNHYRMKSTVFGKGLVLRPALMDRHRQACTAKHNMSLPETGPEGAGA